jgi:arylsulfatase A-like enzyme
MADAARGGRPAAPPAPADDGESITALLKGGSRLKRDTLYWHYPHYHPGSATPYSATREGDWKLVHFFEDDRVEFYNLKDDPGEKNDLAASEAKRAAELRAKLNAWRASIGAQIPTRNPNYDPAKEWDNDRPAGKNPAVKGKKK